MNNMRRGFTMIELIFVIVIIGILAAVAIPKLAGTAKEAHNSVVKSFVGTMNRTVGATLYAKSVAAGNAGSVTGATYCGALSTFTDIPAEITSANTCVLTVAGGATGSIAFTDGTTTSAPKWVYTP